MPTAVKRKTVRAARKTQRSKANIPYAVASAIRGPDNYDLPQLRTLKVQVTARLRAMFYTPTALNYAAYNAVPMTDVDLSRVRTAIEQLRSVSMRPAGAGHFIDHLVEAVEQTKRSRLWGGHGEELVMVLASY